jgi:hypothetical protein
METNDVIKAAGLIEELRRVDEQLDNFQLSEHETVTITLRHGKNSKSMSFKNIIVLEALYEGLMQARNNIIQELVQLGVTI